MRYDDQTHLDGYTSRRNYPRIHRDMWDVFASNVTGYGTVLDLCCSTGLLGAHVRDGMGLNVVWADCDTAALVRGVDAGAIAGPVWAKRLTIETLGDFSRWMREHEVRTVIARRALYVVAESLPLTALRDTFQSVGVQEVVLEGLRLNGRARHPSGPADVQAAALAPAYEVVASLRDVRYLRLTT